MTDTMKPQLIDYYANEANKAIGMARAIVCAHTPYGVLEHLKTFVRSPERERFSVIPLSIRIRVTVPYDSDGNPYSRSYTVAVGIAGERSGNLRWRVTCWENDTKEQAYVSRRECALCDTGTLASLIGGAYERE